jgi:radical SAM superfamily enzyme YgiQ (UPF0313 family)
MIDWANQWELDQLKQLAKSRINNNTKWIGVGLLFSSWPARMEEFLSWVKQQWPHLIIICGGPTKPSFNSNVIDYYTQGYSEYAIIDLLKYLFSNGNRPKFELFKVNNRHIILANDTYPTHPVNDLMIRYEDRDFIHPGEFLGIEFARGCKFQCAFCNYPILGVKGDYSRDTSNFRYQMTDAYDRFGVTNYFITDETFNDRTDKITKFADVVDTLPFRPWFSGNVRANLLISRPRDREELLRMKVLGQFHGVETFNADAGKLVGKGMNGDKLKNGLLESKAFFEAMAPGRFLSHISLIVGLPKESMESVQQSTKWLETNYAGHSAEVNALRIYYDENSKPSQMSKDYEKYGYTVIDSTGIDGGNINNGKLERTITWKSEFMDIYQAQKFEKDWRAELASENSVYRLHPSDYLTHPVLHELPIEERLKLNLYDLQVRKKKHYGLVDRYIQQKLNL